MQSSPKIVAVVPFHKRLNISKIFWRNIEELQKSLDLEVVAIVSDNHNETLAKKKTSHIVRYRNMPVGTKWNAGVAYCSNMDYDYMMILGSDDIFCPKLIDLYMAKLNKSKKSYVGLLDAMAINMYTKKARYFPGYKIPKRKGESVGSGRFLSQSVIQMLGHDLFAPKNSSLDYSMTYKMKIRGVVNVGIYTGKNPYRLGLKSHVSIGKMFGKFNIHLDRDVLNSLYGTEVVDMIYKFG